MTNGCFKGAAAALFAISFGFVGSAQAAPNANRAWVSGHGADQAGCGSPASPCRTLQYAHDNIVAAGGEIDVLDPAGYGAITIAKAISIVNDGVGTAGVQQGTSQADAITINAGSSDAIYLRGLTVYGLGSGWDGVLFNSGGKLTITNCVFRHFVANGVDFNPSAAMTFSISDTVASDNGGYGVSVRGTAGTAIKGTIARSRFDNNTSGVIQEINNASALTIVDTVAANNFGAGFELDNGQATLSRVTASGSNYGISVAGTVFVSDSTVSGNALYGVLTNAAGGVVTLTRLVATGNGTGVGVAEGTAYTYHDNTILQNGTDVSGSLTTAANK